MEILGKLEEVLAAVRDPMRFIIGLLGVGFVVGILGLLSRPTRTRN